MEDLFSSLLNGIVSDSNARNMARDYVEFGPSICTQHGSGAGVPTMLLRRNLIRDNMRGFDDYCWQVERAIEKHMNETPTIMRLVKENLIMLENLVIQKNLPNRYLDTINRLKTKYQTEYLNEQIFRNPENSNYNEEPRGPRTIYHSSECSICYENMCNSNGNVKTLECGHQFHRECINEWFTHRKNCPICRQLINN